MSGNSLPGGSCPEKDNGVKHAGFSVAGMRPEDVPEVAALERSIFSMPWSENGFLSALQQPDALYLVVREPCDGSRAAKTAHSAVARPASRLEIGTISSSGCAEMAAAECQRASDSLHAETAFCEPGKEKLSGTSVPEAGADSLPEAPFPEARADRQEEVSFPEAGAGSLAEVFFPEASPDNLPEAVSQAKVLQGRLIGYCGLLQSFDEADIVNVAVREDCRGQGIGFAMLSELMRRGRLRGIERFTLEVRRSNAAALHLYEKLGFLSVGIRRNFYEKPREDAVIMWTSMPGTADIP